MCYAVQHRVKKMRKLNWTCTSCGRTFSRRFSAQRHIDNYNIHNGLGQAVPYAEYSLGIREGKYWPQSMPRFNRAEHSFLDKAFDKIAAEVENNIVRDIAKRVYNAIANNERNQVIFDNLAEVVGASIIIKNVESYRNGSEL